MMRVSPIVLFLVFALILPLPSLAASLAVNIGITPAYPAPNQLTTIKARSTAPKGAYTYIWSVNGAEFAAGIDRDTITLLSGAAGQETEVEVSLIDINGNSVGGDIFFIRPGSVDVVWEGRSYVPPFYRGQLYPNGDSKIVLEAIPHLSDENGKIAPNNLVYLWEADGKKLTSLSGYGRSTISISPTVFKNTTTVSVTVETRDGFSTAKGIAAIPIVVPQIVFYENKPLAGFLFNRAVPQTVQFLGEEMTFRAVPFFVTAPETMAYEWTLNGEPFSIRDSKPDIATFRKTGEGGGVFSVGITIVKNGSIFERAGDVFNLSFE